ncbi:MAG: hypothetical protein KatS3mg051_2051 [Anaerolineae bacterium]|nr:MAG: hypothetical protein KatS3mg051_2051 [Anaerolineae bacterium]
MPYRGPTCRAGSRRGDAPRRPSRASPIPCVAHRGGDPPGRPPCRPPPRNNVTPVGDGMPCPHMPYRGPPCRAGSRRGDAPRRPSRASPIPCVAHRRGDPPGRPYMPSPHMPSPTPQQRNPRWGTACRVPTCRTVAPHAAPVHVGATHRVAHRVRRPYRASPIVGATRRVVPPCRAPTPQQRNPRRGTACRAPTCRAPHAVPCPNPHHGMLVWVGATRCVAQLRASPIPCVARRVAPPCRPPTPQQRNPRRGTACRAPTCRAPTYMPYRGPTCRAGSRRGDAPRRPYRASPIACVAHCVGATRRVAPTCRPPTCRPPPRNNVTPRRGTACRVPTCRTVAPHAAPVHVWATHRVAHRRGDPPGRPYMPPFARRVACLVAFPML